jgi:hypothetical protein
VHTAIAILQGASNGGFGGLVAAWPAKRLALGVQIVPFADAGPLAAKLLKNGTLKVYKGLPHGMPTTHAEIINADLLAFIQA